MNKLTKQGVRDLNYIKAPPGGKVLPELPDTVPCKHKYTTENYYHGITCDDCGKRLVDYEMETEY